VRRPPEQGSIDERLVQELTRRGVNASQARKTLAGLPPDQDVRRQLSWGDALISQQPDKYRNPPGLYLSLIRDNVQPPKMAADTKDGGEAEPTKPISSGPKLRSQTVQQDYQDYLRQRTRTYITKLSPSAYEDRLTWKMRELSRQSESFSKWVPEAQRKIAQTALFGDLQKELPLLSFSAFCEHKTRFSSEATIQQAQTAE
jgi:hypothetical protein